MSICTVTLPGNRLEALVKKVDGRLKESGCSSLSKCDPATPLPPISIKHKKVVFTTPVSIVPKIEVDIQVDSSVQLCQVLSGEAGNDCMGLIRHDAEMYHLHPFTKRKRSAKIVSLSLDQILSTDFEGHLTRRQRYSVALLLASSVAQLRFTPWLRNGLTKNDILFFPCEHDDCTVPYHEPFIRQGFLFDYSETDNDNTKDYNFYSLGILLLELCFGQRLEDHALRRRYPAGTGESSEAFDLVAALKWLQGVSDEGGADYASAVKWCFTGANDTDKSWRHEMIKNVIRPLEMCQEHFKMAAVS
ncbi:Nn.00g075500.m01.CDS01 [Neocucurbitaria sp. VM-36]